MPFGCGRDKYKRALFPLARAEKILNGIYGENYNNYNYALRLTNGKIINNKIIATDKKIYLEMVNILR